MVDNVIPFRCAAAPEAVPDSDCVCVIVEDGKPVKWFRFCCSFDADDGGTYCFDIWARDWNHAEAMLAAARRTARIDGQKFGSMPA